MVHNGNVNLVDNSKWLPILKKSTFVVDNSGFPNQAFSGTEGQGQPARAHADLKTL